MAKQLKRWTAWSVSVSRFHHACFLKLVEGRGRTRLGPRNGGTPVAGLVPSIVMGSMTLVMIVALAIGRVNAQDAAAQLDREQVRASVESIASIVEQEYFDAALAAHVASALRERLARGDFDGLESYPSLASKVSQELWSKTHDKHLAVTVVPEPTENSNEQDSERNRATIARQSNYGVQRVEILGGNVGYLNLTAFYRPEEARETLSAAMQLLRSADALIIDMRENGGGSPDTVVLLASYLWAQPGLSLFEIVPRSATGGRSYQLQNPCPPECDESRPVFVLTAKETFSAGEGFAFLLQERRRAEIIGEPTAGAANPGRTHAVNPHLEVTVPNGQVRSSLSGKNWEGQGVQPDVPVAAAEALGTAHARALRELISRSPNEPQKNRLRKQLEQLPTPEK